MSPTIKLHQARGVLLGLSAIQSEVVIRYNLTAAGQIIISYSLT